MTELPPIIKPDPVPGTHRVLIRVSYDGTAYAGWQRQQNALAVYLLVVSNNFISIFSVFAQRTAAIQAGTVTTGTNYIISGILFILALISCFAIIPVFAVKGVSEYQYAKRYF